MTRFNKLIAIGDSFLAGSELANANTTWPALFADQAGLEYQCLAKPGHSAQYILRTLFDSLYHETQNCFYVIHWPSSLRIEYVNRETDTWVQILPNDIISPTAHSKEFQRLYYQEVNSLLGDKWQGLLMVYCAIQALKNTKHVYSMTTVDDFHFKTDFHNPPYISFLQKQCASHIQWFDQLPFQHWATKMNFPQGPKGHPLEDAHLSACNYLKKYYNKLLS